MYMYATYTDKEHMKTTRNDAKKSPLKPEMKIVLFSEIYETVSCPFWLRFVKLLFLEHM